MFNLHNLHLFIVNSCFLVIQGTVALSSRTSQKTLAFAAKPKPLLARYVLEQFRVITQTKGDKAQGRKVDIIKAMMVKGQGPEAKYVLLLELSRV
jgi:hypothetical protein